MHAITIIITTAEKYFFSSFENSSLISQLILVCGAENCVKYNDVWVRNYMYLGICVNPRIYSFFCFIFISSFFFC